MASKVKGAARIEAALRKVIPEIKSVENMRKIGEQASAMIKLRTRLGAGVAANGDTKAPLKKLTKTTIEVRKGNLAFFKSPSTGKPIPYAPDDNGAKVKLHSDTSPSKSNLTRTGQLLDSEQVTSAGYGKVAVGPKGERSDDKTNEQIGEYVTKGGRPYNNLSKREVDRLQQTIKKQLRDLLKKVLTK